MTVHGFTTDEIPEPSWPHTLAVVYSPDPALYSTVLPLGTRLRIGRADGDFDLDLAIEDSRISRRHTTIEGRDDHHHVEDLVSSNGTWVNGERVQSATLTPGSVVRIGDTIFEYGRETPIPDNFCEHDRLSGRSIGLRRALEKLALLAPTDDPALIVGESGTGKGAIAKEIHRASSRSGSLQALDCRASPPAKLEAQLFGQVKGATSEAKSDTEGLVTTAAGGTLFIDEVARMPVELQLRLVQLIDAHEYTPKGSATPRPSSVRVLAAAQTNLWNSVNRGAFSRDLYARLSAHTITLPPLRSRRIDIPPLAQRFLREASLGDDVEVAAAFFETLVLYAWPLNLHELKATMEQVVRKIDGAKKLRRSDLSAEVQGLPPPTEQLADSVTGSSVGSRVPRVELEALLEEHMGNITRVAESMGKDRKQIYRWLKRLSIDTNEFRPVKGRS